MRRPFETFETTDEVLRYAGLDAELHHALLEEVSFKNVSACCEGIAMEGSKIPTTSAMTEGGTHAPFVFTLFVLKVFAA